MKLLRHILSPVYFKEVVQIATQRRTFWVKTLFVVILLGASGLVMAAFRDSRGFSQLGLTLFGVFSYIELIAVMLLAPLVTAGSVSGERQANTLNLLFLTRLNNWNIVQDKGLSRITYLLMLCSLTFPFLFGAMLFGGVEVAQVWQAVGFISGSAVFCGGVGIFCSTFSGSYLSAVIKSYALIILALILPPIGVVTLHEMGLADESLLFYLNPFIGLAVSLDPWVGAGFGLVFSPCVVMLVICVCCYVLAAVFSAAALRRDRHRRRSVIKAAMNDAGLQVFRTFFSTILQPARLLDFRPRSVGRFPILWKNSGFGGHRVKSVVANACLFGVGLTLLGVPWLVMIDGWGFFDEEEFWFALLSLWLPVIALFTALLASAAFTSDRGAQRLDLLLATRLSAGTFVFGTLFSLLRSCAVMWLIPVGILFLGGLATALNDYNSVHFFSITPLVILYLLLTLVIGAWMSLRCRTTPRAAGLTVVTILAICLGPFLIGGIVDIFEHVLDGLAMLLGFYSFGINEEIFFYFSPAAGLIVAGDDGFARLFERAFLYGHGSGLEELAVLLYQIFLTVVVIIGLTWDMANSFDRINGRQSGRRFWQ